MPLGDGQVLFQSDFSKPLNSGVWDFNHAKPVDNPAFYGRTHQRQALPEVQNGMLVLKLDTFRPGNKAGDSWFLGSEAITRQLFGPNIDHGPISISFVARFSDAVVGGYVGGLFTFMGPGESHDEIDWEALSNRAHEKTIFTNIYHNEPTNSAGHSALVNNKSDTDLTAWHTYRIEWSPNLVRWYVDGATVRKETNVDLIPTKDSNIHLNIWAPDSNFSLGYNSALQPVNNQGQNTSFDFYVKSVTVAKLDSFTGTQDGNHLVGTGQNDRLAGLGGNDKLLGKSGADNLFGGQGDDILIGGAGRDHLAGGPGHDTFVFGGALTPNNIDVVRGFDPAQDLIQLTHNAFSALPLGHLSVAALRIGPTASDGHDRIIYDPHDGWLSYDKDGSGDAAPHHFATLAAHLAITAADFIVA